MAALGGSGFIPGGMEPGGLLLGQVAATPPPATITWTAYPTTASGGVSPAIGMSVNATNEYTAQFSLGGSPFPAKYNRMARFSIRFAESQTLEWQMPIEDEDGSMLPDSSPAAFPLPVAPYRYVVVNTPAVWGPAINAPPIAIGADAVDPTKVLTVSGTLFNSMTDSVQDWGPWFCLPKGIGYQLGAGPGEKYYGTVWSGRGVMDLMLKSKRNLQPLQAAGYATILAQTLIAELFQTYGIDLVFGGTGLTSNYAIPRFNRQRQQPAAWLKSLLDVTQAQWIEKLGTNVVEVYQPNFTAAYSRCYDLSLSQIQKVGYDESSNDTITQLTGQRADDVGAVVGSATGGPFGQATVTLSRSIAQSALIRVLFQQQSNGVLQDFNFLNASGGIIETRFYGPATPVPPSGASGPCTAVQYTWGVAAVGQTTPGVFRFSLRVDTGNYNDTQRAFAFPAMANFPPPTPTSPPPIANGLPGYGCTEEELGANPLLSDIATLEGWVIAVFFRRGARVRRWKLNVPLDPWIERGMTALIIDPNIGNVLAYVTGFDHTLSSDGGERRTNIDLVFYQQLVAGTHS
jgi:hypothetical protein